ncbi:Rieske (2Fe-2S) protein [Methylovorus sp. MM2]|uniref:aromatic ring-hydroxylating oxygenase subunit alpha n=1 Tax=Methylovorus sp. MM2 TaxID=1848038 RepID=UPI0007DF48CD|nr:aromatic ring-hydroxylating dioxygenase subunit alpha [Methylovorus sp. MM2]OAM52825.1 Rieske (2Fe-2S) protein [Methylovorus sp. MM2]
MISLASVTALKRPSLPQLPVSWYADPNIYALEQKVLFANAPQYVGHERMVPNQGDYHTLDWMQQAKALVNNGKQVSLVSNVCRHRQAIMLNGRGQTKHIVCPLHRWTYNLQGELLGAPHFEENPCLHLNKTTLKNWNGLLFDSSRDISKELAQLGCKQDFDFTGYMLDKVMVEEYDFNWKTFIEVYLEDYHVGPFHPGLGKFVDCKQLEWEFGENYSVQTIGVNQSLGKSGSPIYQQWQEQVLQYGNNKTPKHGAIWMVYYPFLMIEWYPNVLVVSHIIPRGTDACTNVVEFYYPEDIALFERAFVEAQQAAYNETAVEDKEICQRMHDGRKALYALGVDERGPYQHPMETGLEHFHIWMRKQLEPHL